MGILDAPGVTKAALAAGYPSWTARGNRTIFLGDSTVAASNIGTNYQDCWPDYACVLSNQRIRFLANAGISGNTSTQMLARLQADVIAKAPNVCIVQAGINDLAASTPFATYQSNMQAIVSQLRAVGIAPVLTTILPQLNNILKRPNIGKWNLWLRRYAEANGIPCLDLHAQIVNAADGSIAAAYDSGDGIHPNAAGYAKLGRYVADTLGPLMPAWVPPLANDSYDPSNQAPDAMFLTDANADGTPDLWTALSGTAGTYTRTLTADASFGGNWLNVARTGAAIGNSAGIGKYWNDAASAGVWAAGDKVLMVCAVASTGLANGNGVWLSFKFNGTVHLPSQVLLTQNIASGIALREVTIPAGTTNFEFDLKSNGGDGTAKFARPTLFNLTKLGLS